MARALLALLVLAVASSTTGSEQVLEPGTLRSAFVNEDSFQYYAVNVPEDAAGVKVRLIPSYGDPDVYASFMYPMPDSMTASWVMDDIGTEEAVFLRGRPFFCTAEPCTLHMSVYGFEESEYTIGAYMLAESEIRANDQCAPGCSSDLIGDGVCQQECLALGCYDDGGDCDDAKCAPGCHVTWPGDGYCDSACFNAACGWDRGDCQTFSGCNPGCLEDFVDDGECDSACNTAECGWDGEDCFHGAGECYAEPDASDYRGTVNVTASGKACQPWESSAPHVHGDTHATYPRAGLGGHNHCRNPDGHAGAWCYTMDPAVRFEPCDVGEPWAHCQPGEMPLVAIRHGDQMPCFAPTSPPSGPLAVFEEACGDGANETIACSTACCEAARTADAYCGQNSRYLARYKEFRTTVSFAQLKHNCTECDAFAVFFQQAKRHGFVWAQQDVRRHSHRHHTGAVVAVVIVVVLLAVGALVLVIRVRRGGLAGWQRGRQSDAHLVAADSAQESLQAADYAVTIQPLGAATPPHESLAALPASGSVGGSGDEQPPAPYDADVASNARTAAGAAPPDAAAMATGPNLA